MSARTRFQELSPTARRRVVLGALCGLLAVIALLAVAQAGRVRTRVVDEATVTSSAVVEATLVPELTAADAGAPAAGERYEALTLATESILADGTVQAVAIWAGDGTVLFADDASLVGDQVRAMRATVLGVIGDEARSDVERGLIRSFVPVELAPGVEVAVELDRSAEPIASAADPWRLMALLAGGGAALLGLLLAHTFTRAGRRAEGFDEETFRAALIARRKAERALGEAAEARDALASELERTRQDLRETEEREREAARTADDAPRLREHLALAAQDLERVEQERDALRERLHEAGRAVEAEAVRGREELAGALAEIERLEGVKLSLQDRAAKAEDAVAHLTKQVADLEARPDIEAELTSVRRHAEATRRELVETRRRAEAAERRNAELEDVADGLQTRVNDLERRPDLSAKLDAAGAALDIARAQIRALSERAAEAGGEVAKLRVELEEARAVGSAELDEARSAFTDLRAELDAATRELETVTAENEGLQDEVEALRRDADAAGELVAASKAELHQMTRHASELKIRSEQAETELERERTAKEAELQRERATAEAERDALARELEELHRSHERLQRERATAEAALADAERAAGGERDRSEVLASERDAATAEVESLRAEGVELGSQLDAARTERAQLRSELERVRAAHADTEAAAAEATARADLAEERFAEAEARFHRMRFTDAFGGEAPVLVSGPDGLAVEVRADPPPAPVNGSTPRPSGASSDGVRAVTKVEVDTLVRRVVQDSWSDRGRMLSVYAEPVTVEARPDAIERVLGCLLESSIARTSEGNRIVVHVERAEDGVLLSVEDGRPPADDATMAETHRLAEDLGGWATVEEHLGGGSISRVHLPRSARAGAPAPG